jgi:hypothetical protein
MIMRSKVEVRDTGRYIHRHQAGSSEFRGSPLRCAWAAIAAQPGRARRAEHIKLYIYDALHHENADRRYKV